MAAPGPGRTKGGHLRVLVEGLDAASKSLGAAPEGMQKELARALRTAARPAAAKAKASAPRRSGRLAASIRVNAGRKGALVGSPRAHAPVLEFAFKGRYASLSDRWGRPPRYLIPAVEESAPEIEREAGKAIQDVLDRAFPEG